MGVIGTLEGAEEQFSALRQRARTGIRDFLRSFNASWLSRAHVIHEYPRRGFIGGWRIKVQLTCSERSFDVLLDGSFPFTAPRLALVDRPDFLTWPHLESDGLICILADSTPTDVTRPVELLQCLLGDAVHLIEALERGEHIGHFRDEFLPYWTHSAEMGRRVYSLLNAGQRQSRLIRCWVGQNAMYAGESEVDISRWLNNKFGERPEFAAADRALFLWLGEPMLPSEYPKTARDFSALLKKAKADEFFPELCSKPLTRLPVVLGFETVHGNCFASLMMYRSVVRCKHNIGKQSDITRGFRPGRIPPSIIASQFLASAGRVVPSMVERIDHSWVHGRGVDSRQDVLRTARVALLGCGSLGSLVAHQLAMAGVGHLFLVDPQTLASSNMGRHHLGARYLGSPKATSLAKELQINFPHQSIQGFQMDWQEFHRIHSDHFVDFTLIMSMTGDWNSEALLNSVHLQLRQRKDLLYGWTEGHACAGHAVLVRPGGGCLACHFDPSGNAERQLTKWPNTTLLEEPACGATFQP
ncbi:MAG TPA: ThiF family adenylyltransferase [Acidobacteriaceae bacterium]|nr:ThiF family adenylyltransferase [Acidobacteriaceae bacterium]